VTNYSVFIKLSKLHSKQKLLLSVKNRVIAIKKLKKTIQFCNGLYYKAMLVAME